MEKEIIEGNAAINKFRGLNLGQSGYANDYHSNWNNLMPVVEKIESDCFDGSLMVFINDSRCHIKMGTQYSITDKGKDIDVPDCYHGFCKTKILAVWLSVVQFIQWYNSINHQTP